MRISDWSSDVCSSDLPDRLGDDSVLGPPRGVRRDFFFEELADRRAERLMILIIGGARELIERHHLPSLGAAERERGVGRSEERRVGKECVSTCTFRRSPYNSKTQEYDLSLPIT